MFDSHWAHQSPMSTQNTLFFPNGKVRRLTPKKDKTVDPRVRGVIFFFVLGIFAVSILLLRSLSKNEADQSAVAAVSSNRTSKETPTPTVPPEPKDVGELIEKVREITNLHEGNYSVRFESFKDTASF